MSDNSVKLGKLVPKGEEGRDAIHIAMIPVVSDVTLQPGQHVGVIRGNTVSPQAKWVGIVDPFLTSPVQPGERFWLCLYPQTITSLKHQWTHPAFPEESVETSVSGSSWSESEAWIRLYAESLGVSYSELMGAASDYVKHGDFFVKGATLEGCYTPPEFWVHYKNVTGSSIPPEDESNFFSCSC